VNLAYFGVKLLTVSENQMSNIHNVNHFPESNSIAPLLLMSQIPQNNGYSRVKLHCASQESNSTAPLILRRRTPQRYPGVKFHSVTYIQESNSTAISRSQIPQRHWYQGVNSAVSSRSQTSECQWQPGVKLHTAVDLQESNFSAPLIIWRKSMSNAVASKKNRKVPFVEIKS
jgi:hypothetical protein